MGIARGFQRERTGQTGKHSSVDLAYRALQNLQCR
jgi:hypothetical protein